MIQGNLGLEAVQLGAEVGPKPPGHAGAGRLNQMLEVEKVSNYPKPKY